MFDITKNFITVTIPLNIILEEKNGLEKKWMIDSRDKEILMLRAMGSKYKEAIIYKRLNSYEKLVCGYCGLLTLIQYMIE